MLRVNEYMNFPWKATHFLMTVQALFLMTEYNIRPRMRLKQTMKNSSISFIILNPKKNKDKECNAIKYSKIHALNPKHSSLFESFIKSFLQICKKFSKIFVKLGLILTF